MTKFLEITVLLDFVGELFNKKTHTKLKLNKNKNKIIQKRWNYNICTKF